MQDIQQVLVREPRHFGALAGLGMIMQEVGDDKRALEAFRRALAVNPYLDKLARPREVADREGRRPRHLTQSASRFFPTMLVFMLRRR